VTVLMEAGFDVVFRSPVDTALDGVDPLLHSDYGGHITTSPGKRLFFIVSFRWQTGDDDLLWTNVGITSTSFSPTIPTTSWTLSRIFEIGPILNPVAFQGIAFEYCCPLI
jgi:hypothetical protein